MNTNRLIIALTTVADDTAARLLARTVVEERLAACVQRVAVDSTYEWQGCIEESPEVLLLIKSTAELIEPLKARVLTMHAYDVPEFVVLETDHVAQGYLTWALAACGRGKT